MRKHMIMISFCLVMFLTLGGCKKDSNINKSVNISAENILQDVSTDKINCRERLYKSDGTYQEFDDLYESNAIYVKPGESYIINGYALNAQFPFVLVANEPNGDSWDRTVLYSSDQELKGNVWGYRVDIPNDANVLIVNTKEDEEFTVQLVKENNVFNIQEYDENRKPEILKINYDKSYFAFILDDTNYFTYPVYKVFHENNVPLSIGAIIECLNNPIDGQSIQIKDVLDLVVEDGGEILVHYSGNLADVGYEKEGITYLRSNEDWFEKVALSKAILEGMGYEIRGIMRADYTQSNSSTGELYARYLYDYSDGIGISGQYNMKRVYMHDFKDMESFLSWIEKAQKNPGFYPIAFHGWEDILKEDGALQQIIDFIQEDDNCEITTYADVYDSCILP